MRPPIKLGTSMGGGVLPLSAIMRGASAEGDGGCTLVPDLASNTYTYILACGNDMRVKWPNGSYNWYSALPVR